jgi:hypothetical protein
MIFFRSLFPVPYIFWLNTLPTDHTHFYSSHGSLEKQSPKFILSQRQNKTIHGKCFVLGPWERLSHSLDKFIEILGIPGTILVSGDAEGSEIEKIPTLVELAIKKEHHQQNE